MRDEIVLAGNFGRMNYFHSSHSPFLGLMHQLHVLDPAVE